MTKPIRVRYESLDGHREAQSFKTIEAAREYAIYWIGENHDLGGFYAVSGDGIGKITVEGCTIAELMTAKGHA